MSRLASALIGAAAVAAAGMVAPAQQPADRAAPVAADSLRWARVTYLAGRSVYVSAGRDDGIDVDSPLEVVRGGVSIAMLRAVVVSSHRASCTITQGDSLAVAVGDSVRFVPSMTVARGAGTGDSTTPAGQASTVTAVEPNVAGVVAPREAGRALRDLGIRGRIGVRYLVVAESDSGAARFTQPAADIRIDGTRIAGSALGITIDARGRRTTSSRPDTSRSRADSRTYVYQMAVSATMPGGGRVAVGRQFSEAFANVSLYDGVSAEVSRTHWGTGLFAGSQPAPSTMGYSTDVREYGTYVQAHDAGVGNGRWAFTLGAIGSYHAADPNREFAFGQLVVSSRRASLFATQEVDYNRGWKTAAGERAVQPTSTYLSAQVRPSESFTMYGGFDSRRNVRLWRDLENPETEFDDRFRQGVWGGLSLRAGGHVRLSADVRSSDGGAAATGRSLATGGSIAVDRVGWSLLGIRARTTRYTSPWLEGWLHSGSIAISPRGGQLRFEIEGGIRDEQNRPGASVAGTTGDAPIQWLSLDSELALGRSWYLVLTGTRESGGWAGVNQGYASLTWRF